MDPLRILIAGVNHGAQIRGANVAIQGLARALRDRGHQVTLGEVAPPGQRAELPGIATLPSPTVRKSLYPVWFALRSLRAFDVIHANDQSAGALAARSRLLGRLPLVAQLQPPTVSDDSLWRVGWRRRWIGLAARHAPSLLVPSHWLAEALGRRFGRDPDGMHVIPYGVGSGWFEADPVRGAAGAPLRIVLVNMKGVELALEAFARAGRGHDVRLELYGVGRQPEAQRRLAAELGIADRVEFCGFVPNAELPARIAGADLLLHPSPSESFGQVLAEAAALGLPAVATRVGAIPEVVLEGETGLLCTPGDVEAFARALASLLGSPESRRKLGDAARDRARRLWRWDAVAARIEAEVYAPLLERAAARPLDSASGGKGG